MKQRVFYPIYFSFVLCSALLAFTCASVGPKEKAFHTYQTIHGAISTAQDIERVACIPSAADATKCTSKLAPTFGLTDAKHVEFNRLLGDALRLEEKVGIALKAWKAGDPVPTDVQALTKIAQQVLALAETLLPTDSDARRLVANAKDLVTAVQQIADALKGGK